MENPCIHGFLISDPIGRGTSGTIFHATRLTDDFHCCVKVIPKSRSPPSGDSFESKFHVMKSVTHPNIVRYIDLVEDADNRYLFMEYCSGRALLHLINANHGLDEPLARSIFSQLAETVRFLHERNICHRDIKLEHIIVGDDGRIKLIDFGLCAVRTAGPLSTFCGSLHYSAPEALMRQPYDGCKADAWSVGVVLYAMLTGKLPFDGRSTQVTTRLIVFGKYPCDAVPPAPRHLIRGLLELDPARRLSPADALKHPWVTGDSAALDALRALGAAPRGLPRRGVHSESCAEFRHTAHGSRLSASTSFLAGAGLKLRKRSTSDSAPELVLAEAC